MKKRALWWTLVVAMAAGLALSPVAVYSQEEKAAAAAPAASADAGKLVSADTGEAAESNASSANALSFYQVVMSSGWLGVLLWFFLFGCGGIAVYLAVDCFILIRPKRIMPDILVSNVSAAMTEGDVLKALQHCENEPGPLANILSAGFSHVEEGFDVIQEAIDTAADLETERLQQKITWLAVCGNLAPMLGLLGTVQGMIAAFGGLATGAPDVGALALSIAQALYTTAGGLVTAVPCVAIFYYFRNNANQIVLRMSAMTMELIKDLRNVEVVAD